MRIRSDSQSGPAIPTPDTALALIHQQLTTQQTLWGQRLANDPAALAQLEPEIHHTFQQLADRLVASLLAQAAQQPTLHEQAKKK